MRILIAALCLLALSSAASAQTTLPAGGNYFLAWDQADTDAPTYLYVIAIDNQRQPAATANCTAAAQAGAGFTCELPFPALTPGRHLITVVATVTVNGTTLESAPSDPVDVQLKPVPGKPGGFRIVVR